MNRDAMRGQPGTDGPAGAPTEGVSQFIAKILDQLSVSAWLPATMLVGNVAVLLRLQQQGNLNAVDAVRALTVSPLSALVALLIAVVLATTVAQAFAFEVIRLLEGYWGKSRVTAWLTTTRCGHHNKRRARLQKRRDDCEKRAFAVARTRMLEAKVRRAIVDIQEDEILAGAPGTDYSAEDIEDAEKSVYDWRRFCPPAWLHRLESLDTQLSQYPAPHRTLPTRLGNALRSVEDELKLAPEDDLEGLVFRAYDKISEYLRGKHDQFRNRLDMYCTLVFVFFLLACVALGLLTRGSGGIVAATTVSAVYGILAWTSYRAAIATARAYGTVLIAINDGTTPDESTAGNELRT